MAWRKTLLLDAATVARQHARQLFRPPSEIGLNFAVATSFLWQRRHSLESRLKTATSTTVSFRMLIVVATPLRSLASTTASHKQHWMLPAEPIAITSSTK